MGSTQGIVILKAILAQIGLEGAVDLQVKNGVIEIRPSKRIRVRTGPRTVNALPQADDDKLVCPGLAMRAMRGLTEPVRPVLWPSGIIPP